MRTSVPFPDGAIVDEVNAEGTGVVEFPEGTGVSWLTPLGDDVPGVAPVGEAVSVTFMEGDGVP